MGEVDEAYLQKELEAIRARRSPAEARGNSTVTVRNTLTAYKTSWEIKTKQEVVIWAVRNGLVDDVVVGVDSQPVPEGNDPRPIAATGRRPERCVSGMVSDPNRILRQHCVGRTVGRLRVRVQCAHRPAPTRGSCALDCEPS